MWSLGSGGEREGGWRSFLEPVFNFSYFLRVGLSRRKGPPWELSRFLSFSQSFATTRGPLAVKNHQQTPSYLDPNRKLLVNLPFAWKL
jgi:hypothetical protein